MEAAAAAAAAAEKSSTVCVTGAGGFVASWLVKLLLSTGRYAVRGTVRDPGDGKNAHLLALEGAGERLQLVKADMLDYSSVASAVAGCEGVFHVASPVPYGQSSNPEADVIAPAVTGTLNVLKACKEAEVKRVVVVSSVSAVFNNPNWPKGKAFTEDSWSDEEYCRKNEEWYFLSKTLAEHEAFAYAAKTGLDIVTICPSLVIGPLMQRTVNTSVKVFLSYIKGDQETVQNGFKNLVDVRDVADALLLAYENPQASGRFVEFEGGYTYDTEKLRKLGWTYRPMEETLRDSIECYRRLGILN
ncbi:hypothetical protein PAHAL_6G056000 [Panicum hallii]|uniref:NAD-dependent epimerase/dehydratase domain-containing protein n=1 Tax=Panicum hallii TaxID=206008 RepID=A0A2T8IF97_9POAL|nr:hypothetical protein PAHAL_6G056000 [Panicum hallii]